MPVSTVLMEPERVIKMYPFVEAKRPVEMPVGVKDEQQRSGLGMRNRGRKNRGLEVTEIERPLLEGRGKERWKRINILGFLKVSGNV